jgi:hypothetical protein
MVVAGEEGRESPSGAVHHDERAGVIARVPRSAWSAMIHSAS